MKNPPASFTAPADELRASPGSGLPVVLASLLLVILVFVAT